MGDMWNLLCRKSFDFQMQHAVHFTPPDWSWETNNKQIFYCFWQFTNLTSYLCAWAWASQQLAFLSVFCLTPTSLLLPYSNIGVISTLDLWAGKSGCKTKWNISSEKYTSRIHTPCWYWQGLAASHTCTSWVGHRLLNNLVSKTLGSHSQQLANKREHEGWPP